VRAGDLAGGPSPRCAPPVPLVPPEWLPPVEPVPEWLELEPDDPDEGLLQFVPLLLEPDPVDPAPEDDGDDDPVKLPVVSRT